MDTFVFKTTLRNLDVGILYEHLFSPVLSFYIVSWKEYIIGKGP